jgi:hypothetical protein
MTDTSACDDFLYPLGIDLLPSPSREIARRIAGSNGGVKPHKARNEAIEFVHAANPRSRLRGAGDDPFGVEQEHRSPVSSRTRAARRRAGEFSIKSAAGTYPRRPDLFAPRADRRLPDFGTRAQSIDVTSGRGDRRAHFAECLPGNRKIMPQEVMVPRASGLGEGAAGDGNRVGKRDGFRTCGATGTSRRRLRLELQLCHPFRGGAG